jgi:hypothetical protein
LTCQRCSISPTCEASNNRGTRENTAALCTTVCELRDGDIVYHLSTAPRFYAQICAALGAANLAAIMGDGGIIRHILRFKGCNAHASARK